MDGNTAYEVLRKAAVDAAFLQSISTTPDLVLQQQGVSDPKMIQEVKQLCP